MVILSKLFEISDIIATKNNNSIIANTIGIIIDITMPIYRQKQQNYIMELKIIDQTVNLTSSYGIMNKYCGLYIISSDSSNLLNVLQYGNVGNIGDVIILRGFKFASWNAIKLQTKYTGALQVLQILKASNMQACYQLGNIQDPINYQLSEKLLLSCNQLKNWFYKHINQLYVPQLGLKPLSTHCMMIDPFNMILQVHSEDKSHQTSILILQDSNNNKFYLKLSQFGLSQLTKYENKQPKNLKNKKGKKNKNNTSMIDQQLEGEQNRIIKQEINSIFIVNPTTKLQRQGALSYYRKRRIFIAGQFLLIRQIKYINRFFQIVLTNTGYINVLPQIFQPKLKLNYASIFWDEDKQHYELDYQKRNYQENIELNTKKYQTKIISKQSTSKIFFIHTLLDVQSKYDLSGKKEQVTLQSVYQIAVCLISWSGSLRLFHTEHQMLLHQGYLDSLHEEEKKNVLENKKIVYIWEGKLGVIDRSNENNGKLFWIELFTYDTKGIFFDDHILLKLNDCIATQKQKIYKQALQKEIKQLLNGILEESSFNCPMRMLIQGVRAEKLLFRLINTIISKKT